MKKTSVKSLQTTKILGLALCLGALPLVSIVTGCAGDRYHQSTGEAIDDHGISMHVKSALSNDAEYKYEGVNVETFKGTVQLSGFVDTSAQKSHAAELAKAVDGVKDVENNITVKQ
jgi:hyperosmotically inducible periplasmic protein